MEETELIIPNKIIKSNRKSISLIVKNNGEFIVRAPINCKDSEIFKFISRKHDWIIKKRQEHYDNPFHKITFTTTEQITILGKQYNIILVNSSRVKLNENLIEIPKDKSKDKLISFLRNYARKYLTERVRLISCLFNFKYYNITISSAKTNWGSCSHNNRLHFTYKLIMCPEDIIDYIVLHELCHTKVKNHSDKFWALVEKCNPNYKAYDKWLKKNRRIIEVI